MNKKQLISSDEVRDAAKRGERVIYLQDESAIVTAEAASRAKALGITLEKKPPLGVTLAASQEIEHEEAYARRILATHTGGEINDDLLAEVMRRVAMERASQGSVQGSVHGADHYKAGSVRKLTSIHVNVTAQDETRVSTLDLAAQLGNSALPSAVGFMIWTKTVLNFQRTHDEVLVVLEGNLSFKTASESLLAVSGDVILIPMNLQVEIDTPTTARVFYASYNG